jgi:hypothetical protein
MSDFPAIAPEVGIPLITLIVGYVIGRQVSWRRWKRNGTLP